MQSDHSSYKSGFVSKKVYYKVSLCENCQQQSCKAFAGLVMRTHVQNTVSRCFTVLRQLHQICHSVVRETLQTLVVALVLWRLDCGNAVLVGLKACLIHRLQSVMTRQHGWPTDWLHNQRTGQSPLASHPRTHSVQGRSPCVQSASWTRVTVSRTTDSRLQLSWSTYTPFSLHKSAGHTVCLTVNCRWSGIPRCWPTNLEQSASSCDLSIWRLLPRSDRDSKHFCLKNHLAYSGPSSRLCYLGHFKHLWLIGF